VTKKCINRAREDEYLWKRSRENLIDFYNDELYKVDKGHLCAKLLNGDVRRRLIEYGVLKKHKGKPLILTELGKELLKHHFSIKP